MSSNTPWKGKQTTMRTFLRWNWSQLLRYLCVLVLTEVLKSIYGSFMNNVPISRKEKSCPRSFRTQDLSQLFPKFRWRSNSTNVVYLLKYLSEMFNGSTRSYYRHKKFQRVLIYNNQPAVSTLGCAARRDRSKIDYALTYIRNSEK